MVTEIKPTINQFSYPELSNNYDAMYDTLVSGGVVWLHLNYNNASNSPSGTGGDGYLRFTVTEWYISYDGLVIVCPDGSELVFINGSHTPPSNNGV